MPSIIIGYRRRQVCEQGQRILLTGQKKSGKSMIGLLIYVEICLKASSMPMVDFRSTSVPRPGPLRAPGAVGPKPHDACIVDVDVVWGCKVVCLVRGLSTQETR